MTLDFWPRQCKILLVLLSLSTRVEAFDLSACLASANTDPDQAQAAATVWLKKSPNSQPAQLCRATALFNLSEYVPAAVQFSQLARITTPDPAAAELYDKAAWSYMRGHQNAAAEQEFINTIEHNPDNPQYRYDHAVSLMNNERFWDAINELNFVLKRNQQNTEALALRADCWLKLHQDSRARHDARAALAIQSNHELALAILKQSLAEDHEQ